MANRPTAWELGSQPLPQDSGWLLPFLPALQRTRSDAGQPSHGHVLEIGCGPGLDAARLLRHRFEVTAFDRAPLVRARVTAAGAGLLRADLLHIPFRDGTFDAAVSSLALHYLPWTETRAVFAEVHRVLVPGAAFLFRVNATDDYNHGAGQGEQLEPNFYRTPTPFHSETKRFFDEPMVRAAVDGYFELEHLAHRTIHRYEQPKQAWECLARSL